MNFKKSFTKFVGTAAIAAVLSVGMAGCASKPPPPPPRTVWTPQWTEPTPPQRTAPTSPQRTAPTPPQRTPPTPQRMAPESDFIVVLGSDRASAVIKKYNGSSRNVIIPATIRGMPVKEIGGFSGSVITEVVIPEGVTTIGERAFEGSRWLASVTIPNSVTSIGNRAFANCRDLKSVTIPNSVTSIGVGAFDDLTSVTIPKRMAPESDFTSSVRKR